MDPLISRKKSWRVSISYERQREKAGQGFAIKRSRSRYPPLVFHHFRLSFRRDETGKNVTRHDEPPARVSLQSVSIDFPTFSIAFGRIYQNIEAFSKGVEERGWQFSLPRFDTKTRVKKIDGKIQHFLLANRVETFQLRSWNHFYPRERGGGEVRGWWKTDFSRHVR